MDVVAESGNDPNCDIVRVPCHKLADLCRTTDALRRDPLAGWMQR